MSEKAPVVAKSDVEAQPIWERGPDGVRTPPLFPRDTQRSPAPETRRYDTGRCLNTFRLSVTVVPESL